MSNNEHTLTFITPTILDEAFLFVMGASVKKSSNPIGHFGTGLKYAIAITLRLGGSIKIETHDTGGSTHYAFAAKPQSLRGEDVRMIDCFRSAPIGEVLRLRMPMTADYGKHWEPWMVLRELWSNTKDEGGYVHDEDTPIVGNLGAHTRIIVTEPTIYEAWQNHNKYFLDETRTPLFENDDIAIYPGSSSTFFYRGISVCSQKNWRSAVTYNLKHAGSMLTEDRTMPDYYMSYPILTAIARSGNEVLCRSIFEGACDQNNFEHRISFGSWNIDSECDGVYAAAAIACYKSNLSKMPTSLRTQVTQHMVQHEITSVYKQIDLTAEQTRKLKICKRILRGVGIDLSPHRLAFSNDLEDALAIVSEKNNVIILHVAKTLDAPAWERVTCETLIEEWVHITKSVADETREMQNAYNHVIYQLIKNGEVS